LNTFVIAQIILLIHRACQQNHLDFEQKLSQKLDYYRKRPVLSCNKCSGHTFSRLMLFQKKICNDG